MPTNIWQTRRAQNLRNDYRDQCEEANAPCWLCGQPINYHAAANTPNAFELDHFLPQDDYPELALEPSNFRPAHCSCNRARGKREAPTALGPTTTKW